MVVYEEMYKTERSHKGENPISFRNPNRNDRLCITLFYVIYWWFPHMEPNPTERQRWLH